jgi:hypothetical protein
MKKALFFLVIITLVLTLSSCKRSELTDPSWDGPAGFYILLEGSANPAVLLINGMLNPSTIHVRVTNSNGTPLANQLVFFQQLNDLYDTVAWGQFENGLSTMTKVTNGNGEANVTFFSPVSFYSHSMFIHALLQVNGHVYSTDGIPQDFISIAMERSVN